MITEKYNVYKAKEGGIGQAGAIRLLKEHGIKSTPATSSYEGCTAVIVKGNSRTHKKVSKLLFSS